MQRPFTSGSRQAPDPFDQFLEQNNFYRKHTARDSSCLFRVISEQMFDTQLHHLAIRKKCVRYMRKHHDYFQALVDRDLDEYLDDMSKPKTYGTLVELQAAGYMFQRNVLLFEPFNLGNFFSNRTYFNEVFRVFYTPERHFDSVFTSDYIKDAAMCQSICYEILYKDLYKLPDVSFAVEHMLHSPIYETDKFRSEFNEDGYCLRIEFDDGRKFDFDLPNDTNCILENYKLCHFHYTNFPSLSDDLQREMKTNNSNRDEYDKNALCKTAESLLPNKYVSCVRQLLNEGITPFPYKVAKALDPNMYRNIEFDAWNEHRKELKLQNWYSGDSNFKVGAKCHVKLCKSENDLYTCHIQEIAVDKGYCIVFIEQLGEKRMVPYDSLTPLPPDQFQPWSIPYRFQRQMQKYSSVRFTRHYNYRFKFNEQISSTHEYMKSSSPQYSSDSGDAIHTDDFDPKQQHHYAAAAAAHHNRSSCYYKLKQYTHLENFRTHTVEYCTMPLTVEHMRGSDLDGKGVGGGAGQRVAAATTAVLMNENPSRATRAITPAAAAGVVEEVNGGVKADAIEGGGETVNVNSEDLLDPYDMEQSGAMTTGANIPPGNFILPEFQCYYQMPPPAYAMPEDYYSYGYDPNIHSPATAFLPAGNGSTFYYYTPAANNIYMPGPPIMQAPPAPPLISAAVPAATNAYAQNGSGGGGYYHNLGYGSSAANPVVHAASVPQANSNSHNNIPAVVGRGHAVSTTPLSGRINMEAKKSVKPSGTDLPADVATLRHFYNLGLEYHQIIQKRKQEEPIESWKDNVSKIMGDYRSSKTDENGNVAEYKSVDSNVTSSVANGQKETSSNPRENSHGANYNLAQSHYNNANKSSHPNRRFSSRYFNSNKDRPQAFQRNQQQQQGGGGNNSNSTPAAAVQQTPRHQNDYNVIKNNHVHHAKNSNAHNGTSNAARHHHMQHQNVATPCGGVAVPEQNTQASPMVGYEPVSMGPVGDVAHTPHAYTATPNPIIAYGAYDYTATDPNAMQLAPVPANAATSPGVYIQMPMASAPYGLAYAPPPQPPPMHAAASPGGQFHAPYMGAPPPPPPAIASANMAMHPPPTQATNGFYGTPGAPADVSEYVNVINSDGIQCMAYPPPMPFYYAPNAVVGGAGGGGTPSNNGVGVVAQHQQPPPPLQPPAANGGAVIGNCAAPPPQGYWCAPPPNNTMPTQEPSPQPPSKGNTATTITQTSGDGNASNCNKTPNINGNIANTGTCTQSGTASRHREKQLQTTTTN